jgi:putative Holliday junction resolvase
MGNYLGIDYGKKRIGLSYCNFEVGVAVPCGSITCGYGVNFWESLRRIVKEKRINAFVVGLPIAMDGTATAWTMAVEAFAHRLHKHFTLPVYFSDERLTSYQAADDEKNFGIKAPLRKHRKERTSGKSDTSAATIILQDFLEEHKNVPQCQQTPNLHIVMES